MKQLKPCLNCGFPHTRRGNHCSPECSMDHMTKVMNQISHRHGPYYQKWKIRWQAATGLKIREEDVSNDSTNNTKQNEAPSRKGYERP